MPTFWKYFPAIYLLPFLLATSRFEGLASISEIARWGVMLLAMVYAWCHSFKRGVANKVTTSGPECSIVAFLLICFLSCLWSSFPGYTLFRSGSVMILYMASFFGFWVYVDKFSEDWFWHVFLRTLGIYMAFNLFLGGLFFSEEMLAGRFRGVFENPNNIGMISSVAIPMAFRFWLKRKNKWNLGVLIVLAINLAASGSRTGMLAAGIACGGLLLFMSKKHAKLALPLIACAVVGGMIFTQTSYFEESVLRTDSLESGSGRTNFWKYGRMFISEQPLLGHGFGVDGRIWEVYGIEQKSVQLRGYGVMSAYLGMAVCIGVPLTILFMGGLVLFTLNVIIKFKSNLNILSYALAILGGLFVCVFETALYSAGNCFAFFFWIIMMLVCRRISYSKNKVRLSPTGAII
ncbi:MAG: hypothetical protein ACJAR1_000604 [Rubritalea sp.]|jgi:hypothetical protein